MVQPLQHDQDPPCAVCGQPALRFGVHWRQRFLSEDAGILCLACARATAPSVVQVAEALEAAAEAKEEHRS